MDMFSNLSKGHLSVQHIDAVWFSAGSYHLLRALRTVALSRRCRSTCCLTLILYGQILRTEFVIA